MSSGQFGIFCTFRTKYLGAHSSTDRTPVLLANRIYLLSHALSDDGVAIMINMYYIYLLLLDNNQIYTGSTNDLKRRYDEHLGGKVRTTKNRKTIKLIHYEAYLVESDARRREKFLKTTQGKRLLKQQIRDLLSIKLI